MIEQVQRNKSIPERIDNSVNGDGQQSHSSKYLDFIRGQTHLTLDDESMLLVVDPTKEYESDEEVNTENDIESAEKSFMSMHEKEINLNKKRVYMCKYCDAAFALNEDCIAHEETDHDQNTPHTCNFCVYKSDNRNAIITHIRDIHRTDKPYICVQCNKGFIRRSDLKKHTFVHTGIRPFTCPICSNSFTRKTNLTKHMKILHSGLKPHRCNICFRNFSYKSDLFRHQQLHLEGNQLTFSCRKCHASYGRKDKLTSHEKVCLRTYSSHDQLQKRPRLQPRDQQNEYMPNGEEMAENMVISLDPFSDPQPDDDDDLEFSGEASMDEQNSNGAADSGIPFLNGELTITKANAPSTSQFAPHFQTDNSYLNDLNDFDKDFVCDKCPKRFRSNSALQIHRVSHTNSSNNGTSSYQPPRNFICQVCNKAFTRKRELDRHSVVHTGFKPFECKVCNKRFGRKDKLVRHERIHNEEKLFACPDCGVSFTRKDGLVLHMKQHCRFQQLTAADIDHQSLTNFVNTLVAAGGVAALAEVNGDDNNQNDTYNNGIGMDLNATIKIEEDCENDSIGLNDGEENSNY